MVRVYPRAGRNGPEETILSPAGRSGSDVPRQRRVSPIPEGQDSHKPPEGRDQDGHAAPEGVKAARPCVKGRRRSAVAMAS